MAEFGWCHRSWRLAVVRQTRFLIGQPISELIWSDNTDHTKQSRRLIFITDNGLVRLEAIRQLHNTISWTGSCSTRTIQPLSVSFFILVSKTLAREQQATTNTYYLVEMDFSKGPQIAAAIPHKSNVTSLSYHGSGSHVFAATESDSKLYVINAQTGKMEVPAFRCEREGISRISST